MPWEEHALLSVFTAPGLHICAHPDPTLATNFLLFILVQLMHQTGTPFSLHRNTPSSVAFVIHAALVT